MGAVRTAEVSKVFHVKHFSKRPLWATARLGTGMRWGDSANTKTHEGFLASLGMTASGQQRAWVRHGLGSVKHKGA